MGKKIKNPVEGYSAVSISHFSDCHVVIISSLMNFSSLSALLESTERACEVAKQTLVLFRDVVYSHHTEEELDLFPAALACAAQGEEFGWVKSSVERLTLEHRQLESSWAAMEPELEKIANGLAGDLDASAVAAIVLDYGAHAAFEEREFLPRCRHMLGRRSNTDQMAALDLSLRIQLPPSVGQSN